MFTPSLQPAIKQFCGKNRGLLPLAYTTIKPATKNPTHSTQHSLFSRADKKYHPGAIVAAPSFDAELHIETTTIMFVDVVESVRLIEHARLQTSIEFVLFSANSVLRSLPTAGSPLGLKRRSFVCFRSYQLVSINTLLARWPTYARTRALSKRHSVQRDLTAAGSAYFATGTYQRWRGNLGRTTVEARALNQNILTDSAPIEKQWSVCADSSRHGNNARLFNTKGISTWKLIQPNKNSSQ